MTHRFAASSRSICASSSARCSSIIVVSPGSNRSLAHGPDCGQSPTGRLLSGSPRARRGSAAPGHLFISALFMASSILFFPSRELRTERERAEKAESENRLLRQLLTGRTS